MKRLMTYLKPHRFAVLSGGREELSELSGVSGRAEKIAGLKRKITVWYKRLAAAFDHADQDLCIEG